MSNNPGLKFSWMISNNVEFIFPDTHRTSGG